jgi:hypothetical protein
MGPKRSGSSHMHVETFCCPHTERRKVIERSMGNLKLNDGSSSCDVTLRWTWAITTLVSCGGDPSSACLMRRAISVASCGQYLNHQIAHLDSAMLACSADNSASIDKQTARR